MRVLHVIPGIYQSSGVATVLQKLPGALRACGVETTIRHVTGRGGTPIEIEDAACDVRGHPARFLRHWAWSPALARDLKRHVREFDLVHIHSLWLYPSIAASRAARRAGIPYLVRPAGSLEPWCLDHRAWKKRAYLRLVERRIVDGAAAIHCTSEQEARNIAPLGFQTPTVVVPNGIDPADWATPPDPREARQRLGLPQDRPIILFLGRLHPKKGLDFLLDLLPDLAGRQPDLLLAIVGPDNHEYARSLKARVKADGRDHNVRFLGERFGTAKQDALAAADLFVLPTHSENFGIAVLEAMAAGRPVVVSDNAPWEIVNEIEAGACIPLEAGPWLNTIDRLIAHPDEARAAGQRGRRIALDRFSWRHVAEQLAGVYRDVVKADR